MLRALRARLSYANVMATVAVFIALGGTSLAALKITGGEIAPRTITGRNLRSNSIGGRVVNEKSLKPVPRAHNAARLGGLPAEAFLVGCPEGTIPVSGACVETQAHPPAPYSTAIFTCEAIENRTTPGRRLPTEGELVTALSHQGIELAPGGELTSEVQASAASPGQIEDLYVADTVGHVGLTPDTAVGAKGYRCVAPPLN
ncbi:MAG: hypothetical protein JST59_19960 [Actinobacteria bacterium]|nr:hypothetical protein [Actinomycetota bacterium]